MLRDNPKIQHVPDGYRRLCRRCEFIPCMCKILHIPSWATECTYQDFLRVETERIVLSKLNFDADYRGIDRGSFSIRISIIALEKKKRSWLFDTLKRALRHVATDVLDYVTAVKASDASMKCSTHAETTAVGIASNVYEQLPLVEWHVRNNAHRSAGTNGTNPPSVRVATGK